MKLINKIFALALAFASIISCTQTLAPMAEPQDFSEETARLNNNVAAAQALAQGQVINSVNVSGSVYNILLANGTQLRIDNKVRSNAPYVEFKDGEWLVDETAAIIVKRIFDMYVNKGMSTTRIADELNRKEVFTCVLWITINRLKMRSMQQ